MDRQGPEGSPSSRQSLCPGPTPKQQGNSEDSTLLSPEQLETPWELGCILVGVEYQVGASSTCCKIAPDGSLCRFSRCEWNRGLWSRRAPRSPSTMYPTVQSSGSHPQTRQLASQPPTYLAHGLILRARPLLRQNPAPPVANQNFTVFDWKKEKLSGLTRIGLLTLSPPTESCYPHPRPPSRSFQKAQGVS